MLESYISSVLNQLLGQFIEDIDQGQLGTSILSGSLLLTNMQLKTTLFDDSPLPFAIKYGHVGRIYLKIPIWDMFKSPLVIEIEDVFGFIEFKPQEQWSDEQQKKAFIEGNQQLLSQFEEYIKQKVLLKETKIESANGYKEKIVARILDNLQISIKRIYFRFEDKIIIKNTPSFQNQAQNGHQDYLPDKFSIGIKLYKFVVQTTNKEYQKTDKVIAQDNSQKNLSDESKLTFKIAQIIGLSIFCNWKDVDNPENGGIDLLKLQSEKMLKSSNKNQYLNEILQNEFENQRNQKNNQINKNFINDFNAELRLQLNKDISNPLAPATLKYPQIQASLIIGSLFDHNECQQIQIFQPQIIRILKTLELIGFFNEFREGSLHEIMKRHLTSHEKDEYIKQYITYKIIQTKIERKIVKQNDKQAIQIRDKIREQMKDIEQLVDVNQIIELRQQGQEKVKIEDERDIQLANIEADIQKEINKQIGYGFLINQQQRQKIEQDIRESFKVKKLEIEQEFQNQDIKIQNNINALISEFKTEEQKNGESQQAQASYDFDNLPIDYEFFKINIIMPNMQTSLINEYDQVLIEINILQFKIDYIQSKKYLKIQLDLDEFHIQDVWNDSEIWPYIIQTQAIFNEQSEFQSFKSNQDSEKALQIFYEQNQEFKACPFHIKIFSHKSCHLILNVPLLNEIMRSINQAFQNEKLDFDYFKQYALDKVNQMRKQAKDYAENIKKGQYQHSNVSIEADIFAPVLIIPEDVFVGDARYIKIDMGQINLTSDLRIYNKQKNYKEILDEKQVYDTYKFELSKFSLKIIEFNESMNEFNVNIIQDVSFQLKLKNCLDPLHKNFPTLKINTLFNDPIKVELAEGLRILKMLIQIKELLMVQLSQSDYNAVEKGISEQLKELNQFHEINSQVNIKRDDSFLTHELAKEQAFKSRIQKQKNKEEILQDIQQNLQSHVSNFQKKFQKQQIKEDDKQNKDQEQIIQQQADQNQEQGNGTNMHISVEMNQLILQFGILGEPTFQEKFTGFVDKKKVNSVNIWQTDRIIFEMKKLNMLMIIEKNQTDQQINLEIQNFELRECLANEYDQNDLQNCQNFEDKYEAKISRGINIYRKIIFWNQNENQETFIGFKKSVAAEQQIKAEIKMEQGFHDDLLHGPVIDQSMTVDLQIQQTIFLINIETQKRIILFLIKLLDIQSFMTQCQKKIEKFTRNQIIKALDIDSLKDIQLQKQKQEFYIRIFQNMAAMTNQQDDMESFLKNAVKILDIKNDSERRQRKTQLQIQNQNSLEKYSKSHINNNIIQKSYTVKKKTVQSQILNKQIEQDKLFQNLEKKDEQEELENEQKMKNRRKVEIQEVVKVKSIYRIQIQEINMLLCNYNIKENQSDVDQFVPQILQFKFQTSLDYQQDQLIKKIHCSQITNQEQQGIQLYAPKLDIDQKIINRDDQMTVKLKKIQIEQKIFESWDSAKNIFDEEYGQECASSNILDPTDITILMTTNAQLYLDCISSTTLNILPLNLSSDYKDISYFLKLSKYYEISIQPNLDKLYKKMQIKTEEITEQMQQNIQKKLQQTVFKNNNQSQDVRNGDELSVIKEADYIDYSQIEMDSVKEPAAINDEQIQKNDPKYLEMIKYKKGEIIFINQPDKFRKQNASTNISIEQIQIEFCDSHLKAFTMQKQAQITTILLIKLNKFILEYKQNQKLNDFQETKFINQIQNNILDKKENNFYLELIIKMKLEAQYFNYITQNIEPFIEPWNMILNMSQQTQNSHFMISLNSDEFLNINVTYGMASSLRNVQLEVDEVMLKTQEELNQQKLDRGQIQQKKGDFLNIEDIQFMEQYNTNSQRYRTSQRKTQVGSIKNIQQAAKSQYTIRNFTCLDFGIQSSNRELQISRKSNDIDQILDNQINKNNQKIFCKCDNSHPFLQPICDSHQINIDSLYIQSQSFSNKIQIEDDLKFIDMTFQAPENDKQFEFHNIQIENNGVYSYVSVLNKENGLNENSQHEKDLQKNNLQTEDYLTLIMNISNKGSQRFISLESQLTIQNNTEFPYKLFFSFRETSQEIQEYSSNMDIEENAQKKNQGIFVDIQGNDEFKVPLKWYIISMNNLTQIDMYIVEKHEKDNFQDDENQQKKLIYSNITQNFCGLISFDSEIESKIIELNKDLYVSVDIYGYKCLPKHSSNYNPIQFSIQFNPPLIISNRTMCPLQVYEIDFPETENEVQKLLSRIPAGMSDNIFQLDILESNESNFQFKLFENQRIQHKMNEISLTLKSLSKFGNKLGLNKQLNDKKVYEKEYITTEIFIRQVEKEIQQLDQTIIYTMEQDEIPILIHCKKRSSQFQSKNGVQGERQREVILNESKAIQLSIFQKYMIVNKTQKDLIVGNTIIQSKTTNFLSTKSEQSIINLKVQNFKQSVNIDLKQIGMNGVIYLDSEISHCHDQLQFGVSIQLAPPPFNKTIILQIVPRYLIINKLQRSIAIKQVNDRRIFTSKSEIFFENESQIFLSIYDPAKQSDFQTLEIHFQKQKKSSSTNNISISTVKDFMYIGFDEKQGYDTSEWCLPFSVDQLDDFQTQINKDKLINDNQEDLKWCDPQESNNYRRIVRVIITPNQQDSDATLLIILEQPVIEDYIIKNKTDLQFDIYKYSKKTKNKISDEFIQINPGQRITFVWDQREINEKYLQIFQNSQHGECSLDTETKYDSKKKQFLINKLFIFSHQRTKMLVYTTLKITEMSQKILTINWSEVNDQSFFKSSHKLGRDSLIEKQLQQLNKLGLGDQQEKPDIEKFELEQEQEIEHQQNNGINFQLQLKGIGFSFIDNFPKELMYASMQDLKASYIQFVNYNENSKQLKLNETKTEISLEIGNIQIDNLVNDDMPVIFGAKSIYQDLVLNEYNYDKFNDLKRQFRTVDPIYFKSKKPKQQKMLIFEKIKNELISHQIYKPKIEPFMKFKVVKSEKNYEQKVGSYIRFEEIHFAIQEFCFQANTSVLLRNLAFVEATVSLFSSQEDSMSFVSNITKLQIDQFFQKKMQDVCQITDAKKSIKIDNQQANLNKFSFGVIMLGTIKMKLSLSLDPSKLSEMNTVQGSSIEYINDTIQYLGPFIQSLASISDLTITLNELILYESFITMEMLQTTITNHYISQVKRQIVKIIGSSNLLGNPAGLIDKIGVAVYTMARDPLDGMKQGPKGFVQGIGSGMQQFVKGVVGGSFQSLAQMNGSLYFLIKTATGQVDSRTSKQIQNITQGLFQGVKGFLGEIFRGLTGIVYYPIKGAVNGGIVGFFRGIGQGIAVVVVTPLVSLLRASQSVSLGIAGSANQIGNMGKKNIELLDSKTVRVRESRRIDLKGRISVYDENIALVNYYINKLESLELKSQQIRLWERLPAINSNGRTYETLINILIITTDFLILVSPVSFQEIKNKNYYQNKVLVYERLDNIVEFNIIFSPRNDVQQHKQFCYLELITNSNTKYETDSQKVIDPVKEKIIIKDESSNKKLKIINISQIAKQKDYQTLKEFNQINYAGKKNEIKCLTDLGLFMVKKIGQEQYYENVLNFDNLLIQKINGMEQFCNSKVVQALGYAYLKQSSNIIEQQNEGIQQDISVSSQYNEMLHIQNTKNFYQQLNKISNYKKKRTILYSGEDIDKIERVYKVLEQYVIKVRENSTIMKQLKKEAFEFKKEQVRDLMNQHQNQYQQNQ